MQCHLVCLWTFKMPTLTAFRQHLKTITAQGWGTIALWKKHPIRPRTIPLAAASAGNCHFYADVGCDHFKYRTAWNCRRPEWVAIEHAAGGYFLHADGCPADSFERLFGGQVRNEKVFFGSIAGFMLGSALCAASGPLFGWRFPCRSGHRRFDAGSDTASDHLACVRQVQAAQRHQLCGSYARINQIRL